MSIRLKQQITVPYHSGLHLRAAQMIAGAAQGYQSTISVVSNQSAANAKSLLELLMLAAERGTVLMIEVDGTDAIEAMDKIVSLLTNPTEVGERSDGGQIPPVAPDNVKEFLSIS